MKAVISNLLKQWGWVVIVTPTSTGWKVQYREEGGIFSERTCKSDFVAKITIYAILIQKGIRLSRELPIRGADQLNLYQDTVGG